MPASRSHRGRHRRAPRASGNRCVSPPSGAARGVPARATSRPARVRAAGDTDLLAEHRSCRDLRAVHRAREVGRPGAFATKRAEIGIGAELLGDRMRIRIEVEQPAAALHRRREVPKVVEPQHRARRGRAEASARRPPRRGAGAVHAGRCHRRSPRHRGRPALRGTRAARRRRRALGTAGATRSAPGGATSLARRARRRSVGAAAKTARIVSLNWRMLANPAAKATSANGQLGGLDEHAARSGPVARGPVRSVPRRPPR